METAACTLPVTYVKCAFCTAKNHCAACGAELTEALEARNGVENAAVNLLEHTVRVETSLSREDMEDLLEGMGLMVD